MLVLLSNNGQAEFGKEGGYVSYYGFRIEWDGSTIGISVDEKRILEVTKKRRVYYNLDAGFDLEKRLDFIKLKKDGKEVIEISFSNCDVGFKVYDFFVVELQNFLEDGWEIELI